MSTNIKPTPYAELPQLDKYLDGIIVDAKTKRWWVSPHFSYEEIACHCGRPECKAVNWALVIDPKIVNFSEALRKQMGCPIMVNSACRCGQHQAELSEAGYPAATISPHVPIKQASGKWRSFALDLWPANGDVRGMVKASRIIDPDVRIGVLKYGYAFEHADFAWESDPNPNPLDWHRGVGW